MERRALLAALVVGVLLVPVLAFSQANFDLRFDPTSVQTVTGTVVTTVDYNPGNPLMGPQAVVIQSNGQPYTVFLGPGSYLNRLGVSLMPGDTITVTASSRSILGRNYLVASTLTEGSNVYNLRSSAGVPLWSNVIVSPPVGSGPGSLLIPFDTSNMVRESGRIIRTDTMMTAESSLPYVVAYVRPNGMFKKDFRVLLGPADLMSTNGFDIANGKYITASGSSVNINGSKYIVASSLSQGTHFLSLRTSTGVPLFSTSGTAIMLTPPDNNF